MQAAWIISVHLVEAWLFETSPVLGLRGASGSKNTISQVVSHELKIAEHSFPVRLLHCPPNPPTSSPPQLISTPHPTQHTQCFVTEGRLPSNLMKKSAGMEKKERKRRKKKSANWSGHRYMTHIPSHSPHPSPAMVRLSSKDVFTMFYHPIFLECTSGTCELDGKRGENVAETPQRSCVSELSRSPRRRPYPPPPEPFHKRLN